MYCNEDKVGQDSTDISNPENYDMTINTGKMPIESAVEAVIAAVKRF